MDTVWLERLASPDFSHGVATMPLVDLRSNRAACAQLESQLSFARRLVQGRLDIVEAERARRLAGLPASDLAQLVAALPTMLSGKVQSSVGGHRSRDIGNNEDPHLEAEMDAILDGAALVSLPASSDEDLVLVAQRLSDLERALSDRRRRALSAFDTLSAEVVRRFRDGEVSVESVLE